MFCAVDDVPSPVNGHAAAPLAADDVERFEVVVGPGTSYGRLAHLRRALLDAKGVRDAKISGFADGHAAFILTVDPGTSPHDLVLPGTTIGDVGLAGP